MDHRIDVVDVDINFRLLCVNVAEKKIITDDCEDAIRVRVCGVVDMMAGWPHSYHRDVNEYK